MMDLKEIIKWFIPCFHVLVAGRLVKMDSRLTFIVLFLLFNLCSGFAATVNSASDNRIRSSLVNDTKKLDVDLNNESPVNRFSFNGDILNSEDFEDSTGLENGSVGRTFGRPFKKMIQALVPLAFQMGMAATWAVVAALVGIKTLGVTLLILKLLLLAGAFKFGSLFAHKPHAHGWEAPHQPHNKEIHLHIHNGQHGTEEQIISPWNREGVQSDGKPLNGGYDPYAAGPQTLSTPYGHYMKIDPHPHQ